MSDAPQPPRIDPDEELKAADVLLGKADALLSRRHRKTDWPQPDVSVVSDEEDLPILTDIVDPSELAAASFATSPATAEPPSGVDTKSRDAAANPLVERLVALDIDLAREVETWFATEFPRMLSRELDQLSHRLQEETLAHLRATLLPALSKHLARTLEGRAE
jgi:hypothetical protein